MRRRQHFCATSPSSARGQASSSSAATFLPARQRCLHAPCPNLVTSTSTHSRSTSSASASSCACAAAPPDRQEHPRRGANAKMPRTYLKKIAKKSQ
jgi:hypothetical protein